MNNNNNKPLILTIEEAKQELIMAVNTIIAKYDVPCYFIEPTLTSLSNEVRAQAQRELERVRAQ